MAGVRKGAEAVAIALANTLSTNLNAEIDAVQAAWADTIPLPYPKKVFSEMRLDIPDYPALVVGILGGQQTANGAYSPQVGWARLQYEFELVVLIRGDKLEILERQARRYTVALWECIMKHQGLDDSLAGETGVDLLEWKAAPPPYKAGAMQMIYTVGWRGLVYLDESV